MHPEFPLLRMRLASLLLALVVAASSQDVCRSVDEQPYVLFGTKTAYNLHNKYIINRRPQDVPGCEPVAIWLLSRHGAHNPEAAELADLEKLADTKENVINNYLDGSHQPRICPTDLALLKGWSWRLNKTFAGYLTSSGYMETQRLAQTWRDRYPGLFTKNKYDYHFNIGTDKRSSESFHAFADGLFGTQAENIDVPRVHDEKLLMPFKSCPRWTREVEENNDTLKEVEIFQSKREFGEMLANVSSRLGFRFRLDLDTVRRVYEMCRYNKAWDVDHVSPWCAMFSKEDLRLFEYAEDLETFHKYGYGDHADLSAALGCFQVKNMMDFLRKHVDQDEPQQPRVSVQFVEAPVLLSLMTALDGRKDEVPLTGSNYHTARVQSRQWSTSAMVPFHANFAAVLYKCNLNGNFGVKERYQVLFLQNEQIFNMKGFKVGLSQWSDLKTRFAHADTCADVCDGATSLSSAVALSIGLFAFFFRFLM